MNKHIFFDRLTVFIAALVTGRKKFFAQSIDSRGFEELIESAKVEIPAIDGETTNEVEAIIGESRLAAAYRVEQWLGTDFPTIIYHHGNNERPFDYRAGAKNTFFNIFVKHREAFRANLMVVRAPFHDGSLKRYQNQMTELENFMIMLAVSVKMNEAIIRRLREKGAKRTITSGISLGGWVTNLHRSYFNSATIYVPLLAGAFLGEVFLTSRYRKLTGKKALENPEVIRRRLNFHTAFANVTESKVFPLLATYDQFIAYEVQKASYERHPIKTIEAGHVTGALKADLLRAHVMAQL
ncbi:MAG TPA: hypothetical protein ENN22_11705 [bacterium]|nr:hypothetical protein [bacterium]